MKDSDRRPRFICSVLNYSEDLKAMRLSVSIPHSMRTLARGGDLGNSITGAQEPSSESRDPLLSIQKIERVITESVKVLEEE